MATALSRFRLYAPEFASVSDGDVGLLIDDAAEVLLPAAWGTIYPQALARWAAHLQTLAARAAAAAPGLGGGGSVSSISTGALSVAFGSSGYTASTASDAWLSTTPHGLAFLALRDTRAATAPMLLT
jgi:hypothetical protein